MEPAVLGRMCAGGDYYETVNRRQETEAGKQESGI
jgi:hypothetical protein